MEMCNIYHSHSDYLLWLQTDDWVEFYFVFFGMFNFRKIIFYGIMWVFDSLNPGLIDLII